MMTIIIINDTRLNNNFVWRKRFNFAIPHKNTSNRIVTHFDSPFRQSASSR